MNYKLFFFACALNLFYYVPNLLASPIIGGHEDTFNTYKYHVSIQQNYDHRIPNSGEHFCGGTIIHDKYILSVAHCYMRKNGEQVEAVMYPTADRIVVVSGTSETRGEAGIITPVAKIFIPQAYNTVSTIYGDISVLELAFNLHVRSNRERLKILNIDKGYYLFDFYVNKKALILGNGYYTLAPGDDGVMQPVPVNPNKRQFLDVDMTPEDQCPPFEYAICAINRDPSDIRTSCRGDSGSPLVFDRMVIGVLSAGPIGCHSRVNISFTRTSTFYSFIHNAMYEARHVQLSQMYILEN